MTGTDRALATTGALLLAVAVVLAAAAAGLLLGTLDGVGSYGGSVALAVEADADGWVRLRHRGGPALDVRALDLVVTVDGRPLAHQPPVPFFASRGFRGGPTGPFNPAADPEWTPGETAGFRVASTNEPSLRRGARLAVVLYRDGRVVGRASTTVSGATGGEDGADNGPEAPAVRPPGWRVQPRAVTAPSSSLSPPFVSPAPSSPALPLASVFALTAPRRL